MPSQAPKAPIFSRVLALTHYVIVAFFSYRYPKLDCKLPQGHAAFFTLIFLLRADLATKQVFSKYEVNE